MTSQSFKEGYVRLSQTRGNAFRMYYQLHGNGPNKVLFIMGFMSTHRRWKHQVAYFKQHSDQYQVCVFDNRGVGNSDTPFGNYTTSAMALDAIELMDHLGWDKAHIVGLSMGGMISLELASTYPHRLHTLSLAVTHAGAAPPTSGMFGMLRVFASLSDEARGRALQPLLYSPEFLNAKVQGSHDNNKTNYDLLVEEFIEESLIRRPDPIGVMGHIRSIFTHSVSEHRLRSIKDSRVPILILCGNEDRMVKTTNSFYLQQHLSPIEFVQFKTAGHLIQDENNEDFNAALFRHFNRSSNRTVNAVDVDDEYVVDEEEM
ncbi:hypothetical protein SAMD00019534_030780, partial [Acytostelium subglobosum LB1]|uniref:hypothetical protein n=1 Tax=Acytostelium subglobosum LB1 TaxID=1410327 RepID=UPI000644FC11